MMTVYLLAYLELYLGVSRELAK